MPTVQPCDFAQNNYGYNEYVTRATSGEDVFDMQGMKNATLQIRLSTGAGTTLTCTVWAANTDDAVAGSDTNWVDISSAVLGAANYANTAGNAVTSLFVLTSKLPVRKIKVKTVLSGATTPVAKFDLRSSL